MDIEKIKKKLSAKNKIGKITRRIKKNETISNYYLDMYNETEDKPLLSNSKRMKECCQYWDIDYYRMQAVKDILRTNLCRDRFCDNCGNALAIARERKYTPMLDGLSKNFDVYHIVFTIPNPTGAELLRAVDNMYKQFAYIIRLFSGNAKIKGYPFNGYGFVGAVRALEITKNEKEGKFHPHFHTLFVLRKGLRLDCDRKNVNKYSFNNPDIERRRRKDGKPDRYFSDFEILLQKIWKLRIDGTKVNRENILMLSEGYSVVVEDAESNYHQVFKYATKGIFKDGEKNPLRGYEDFKTLYRTLYRRKVIQGYGLLNRFKFEVDLEADAKADEEYARVVENLKHLESPMRVYEYLSDFRSDDKNVSYISRSAIRELLKDND